MLSEIFDWEKIMSVCYSIFYFLILNLLFIVSNIPLFLFLFGSGISEIETYYPAFLVCLIPLGPSLSALFHCMNKLIKNKDIYPWKEYRKSYGKNFLTTIITSTLQMAALFILITNIRFFSNLLRDEWFGKFPVLFFCILFAIIIAMTPNLYMLMMKFHMKPIALVKASLAITIGKPVSTLGNAAAFFCVLILFEIVSGTTFLFMGSIYSFMIVFMNRNLLSELESKQVEIEKLEA